MFHLLFFFYEKLQHELEAILNTISDLFEHSTPTDGRQAALQFLIAVTNGQVSYGINKKIMIRCFETDFVSLNKL